MNQSRASAQTIKITQITDFHLLADPNRTMLGINTEQSFSAVLERAVQDNPQTDLFLLTGDLVQDPLASTYRRLLERLQNLPGPCYCLPGNHDESELIEQQFNGGKVRYQHEILLDGWQILCLDSTIAGDAGGRLPPGQLALLEAKLAEQTRRRHALVCFHHSPLPTGSEWLDTMVLANREELFALLRRFPAVRGIVYGHIHQAMDVTHNGWRLLGCPSTCFQFMPHSKDFALDPVPPGYRRIELHPNGDIVTTVLRIDAVPAGLDMLSDGY